MSDPIILAIDVGTSSLKAVVFTADGAPRDQTAIGYATSSRIAGGAEQAPEDWVAAFEQALHALDHGPNLRAIVFTGTMQNAMAVDATGTPCGPAVLYSDAAVSAEQREACLAKLPPDFAARAGNSPDSAMPVFRFLSADPRLPRAPAVRYHFGAKDYLIERLTGRAIIDPTTATTTGLFNLATRGWDTDVMRAVGIAVEQLPAVTPADSIVGPVSAAEAARLSLPPDLLVIAGSGDAGAATWGAGGTNVGRTHAYLGTTGWVAANQSATAAGTPSDLYRLAAPVGESMIAIAPLLQAGSALDWVSGLTSAGQQLDLAATDRSPPSALFLPYLAGERSPFRDRDVRGAFLGLGGTTGAADLAYAALEGLCHAIRDNLGLLGRPATTLPLIGGVAENAILRQLLADTLDVPVAVSPNPRLATAYGAFLFAAAALGWSVTPLPTAAPLAPRSERRMRAERRFAAYGKARETARLIASDLLATPETL